MYSKHLKLKIGIPMGDLIDVCFDQINKKDTINGTTVPDAEAHSAIPILKIIFDDLSRKLVWNMEVSKAHLSITIYHVICCK